MCSFFSTVFVPDCLKLLFLSNISSNIQHLFKLLSVLKALGDRLTAGKKIKRGKLKKAKRTSGMERKAVN